MSRCRHHIVWQMSGPFVSIGCAHCRYVQHTFETLDSEGDRRRANESQLAHEKECWR